MTALRSSVALLLIFALAACGDDPNPRFGVGGDAGTGAPDTGGRTDDGVHLDALVRVDIGQVFPDANLPPEDMGVPTPDMGFAPDVQDLPDVPRIGPTDEDLDTISDADEGTGDTDGDGTPDAMDTDSDGDGIPDSVEAGDQDLNTPPFDTDGDGTPDFQDLDSDGDGILDSVELTGDPDMDGIPNFRDLDSDGDGIPDATETADDADGDGVGNYLDLDSDGDGISDMVETANDNDGDGTGNYLDLDSDGDGIADATETASDADGDGIGNFLDLDSDGDQITDMVETDNDADMDGVGNYLDLDSDADGIIDATETANDADGDGTGNFLDLDSDGDTIDDTTEGTADIDTDGTPNFLDLDSDGDQIMDMVEGTVDTDMDGLGNWIDRDSDGDTVRDDHEGTADFDGDGAPNYLDLDADNDTLLDSVEAGDANVDTPPRDVDLDGSPDFLDLDSDNDTLSDMQEGTVDTDGDSLPDRHDLDSDDDSILDNVEAGDADLTTAPVDTDGDNTPDFRDIDSDGDTIVDIAEGSTDADGDMIPNFRDLDSDGDGWTDQLEAGDNNPNTPPLNTDTDPQPDYLDLDSDADGLADQNEPGCPAGPDRILSDSDADTFPDLAEIAFGSDPCNPASVIDDFYFVLPPGGPGDNGQLLFANTGIDRADMAINVDTTGSMGGEIQNLRQSLTNTIIPGATAAIGDLGVSVSSYEDYPIVPFGNTTDGDIPFRLGTRVTLDRAAAQFAVNQLVTRNGLDTPESGMEALYQIASGAGTTWNGGAVAPFDPAVNNLPNIADGDIGGVGFRQGALPIIVHVTDASNHSRAVYQSVDASITAAAPATVENALGAIGARIVAIGASTLGLSADPFTPICDRSSTRIFGRINYPVATDPDWYQLVGATAGQAVVATITADRFGSGLDSMIAVYDANGAQLAINDDIGTNMFDSSLTITLSGPAPYYVAVSAFNDPDFNGSGANNGGWYFLDVSVGGNAYVTETIGCRVDDGNALASATRLARANAATPPASVAACAATCREQLPVLTAAEGMAVSTGALIPACAWDAFGGGRPAACGANQCCTGLLGAGVAPTGPGGLCPLTFQIQPDGSGIDSAVVSAIQALVNFSTFTVTTVVRGDPAELASSGVDTACFIQSVAPVSAVPPNTCAPTPTPADLIPPSPQLDSFESVVPGTALTFLVDALNQDVVNNVPCAPSVAQPRVFRAFIDVVADGVTVVDTRDVTIIVPPLPPTSGN